MTFIAYPGSAYAGDWSLLVPRFMFLATLGEVGFVVVPFFRHVVRMSAYEYFGRRFGKGVRLYASAAFAVGHFSKMGFVFYLLSLTQKRPGVSALPGHAPSRRAGGSVHRGAAGFSHVDAGLGHDCLAVIGVEDFYGLAKPRSTDRERLRVGRILAAVSGLAAAGVAVELAHSYPTHGAKAC